MKDLSDIENLMDLVIKQKILIEVFYDYIPDKERVVAMAHAAERIKYENEENTNDTNS